MMRIDHIAAAPDRAGRYLVRFSDGSTMRLYRQTVEDFCLYTGLELDEEQLENLRTAAGEMSAKMRAVRIVSASSVSKKDLQSRLIAKGEDPKQAREAVEWMADLELIDDRKTARQVVERCIYKGYGLARAKQALFEKKIPKEYWEEALEDYPPQYEKITEYLQCHLHAESDQKEIKRAIDALIRRGHSYSNIRRMLDRVSFDTEEFPEA